MILEMHTIEEASQLRRGLAELVIRGAANEPEWIRRIRLETEARAWELVYPPLSQLRRQYQVYC